jgi:outer membrane protein TolC
MFADFMVPGADPKVYAEVMEYSHLHGVVSDYLGDFNATSKKPMQLVLFVTLLDALNQTYQNNIQLNAERENIKASEEDVNIAKADYKPSLTLSGSQSFEDTNKLTNQSGGDATINDVDPFTTSTA